MPYLLLIIESEQLDISLSVDRRFINLEEAIDYVINNLTRFQYQRSFWYILCQAAGVSDIQQVRQWCHMNRDNWDFKKILLVPPSTRAIGRLIIIEEHDAWIKLVKAFVIFKGKTLKPALGSLTKRAQD